MSDVDPDNGDIQENPEPEADAVQPLHEELEDAEVNGLEAEAISAAGQASNSDGLLGVQEQQVTENERSEANTESNSGNVANLEADEEPNAELVCGIGEHAGCVDSLQNDLQEDQLHILGEDREDILLVGSAASFGENNLNGCDTTQAEDEQDLSLAGRIEITAAEWSLEPEDSSNSFAYTGEGAEGGNVERYLLANDEVESQQFGTSVESHRTESGSQLLSDAEDFSSYTGAQGSNCLQIQTVGPQNMIEDLGAALNISDQEDWETNSLPEEEDYYHGPEGDSSLHVEGQVGNGLLETEADQEIELSAVAAASGLLNRDQNQLQDNNEWSDVSCPECVEIQTDSHTNADFKDVGQNESPIVEDEMIGCDINLSEVRISACQNEVSSTDQSVKDKNDSESYEPECDQSVSLACQKGESSQSQSENEAEVDVMAASANAMAETKHCDNVTVNLNTEQVVNADHIDVNIEASYDVEGSQSEGTNESSKHLDNIEINYNGFVCPDIHVVEPAILSQNRSLNDTVDIQQNHETSECDRDVSLEMDDSSISHNNGAIPKTKKLQTVEQKGLDHVNSESAKTLKDESSDVDSEEELLSELESTLKHNSEPSPNSAISEQGVTIKDMRCDQCVTNNLQCSLSNGILHGYGGNTPEATNLKRQLHQAKQLLLERECQISRYVNVQKFENTFPFCSRIKCGSQSWNSQNACQKSKQGRP